MRAIPNTPVEIRQGVTVLAEGDGAEDARALFERVGHAFIVPERLMGPATAMVVLIQPAGLYVAAALYIGFYMRWGGRHGWTAVVLCAVGIATTLLAWGNSFGCISPTRISFSAPVSE